MGEGPDFIRRPFLGRPPSRAAGRTLRLAGRFIAAAAAAALGAGCRRSDSAAFFPVGIYGVREPRALAALGDDGFNAAFVDTADPKLLGALADEARRRRMRLLLPPDALLADPAAARRIPTAACYLADEPDAHAVAPAALAALDRRVHERLPGIPTAFVVGDGHAAAAYAAAGDILMVDWYPVPHLPPTTVGDHVRLAVAAARGKPVWAVLQAMDWRDYPQRDPAKPRVGRFPDLAELRFMAYDAVIEGARGIWFFSYTLPDGRVLPDQPANWFAVTQVSRELSELLPVLEHGARLGAPEALNLGMTGLVFGWRGRKYYILANAADDFANLPEYYWQERFGALFEPHRRVTEDLVAQGGSYWLAPWRVLILETKE